MKTIKFILVLFFSLPAVVLSQGIHFEDNKNWGQIKEKAKKEHKKIFADFYATWCGPCKMMEKNIFPLDEVGQYFNEHFVNIRIQIDQAPGDSESVIKWYKQAALFEKAYSIQAVPTYIIFNSDGEPVHRFIGVSNSAMEFISKADNAFKSDKSYYLKMEEYADHLNDSSFLKNAFRNALNEKDQVNIQKIRAAYVTNLTRLLTKDELYLFQKGNIEAINDPFFEVLLKDLVTYNYYEAEKSELDKIRPYLTQVLSIALAKVKVDSAFINNPKGKISYSSILKQVTADYPQLGGELRGRIHEKFNDKIVETEYAPFMLKKGIPVNWEKIREKVSARYFDFGVDSQLLVSTRKYYLLNKNWQGYGETLVNFMERYRDKLSSDDINNITWYGVFLLSTDGNLIRSAIKWQQEMVSRPRTPDYDAYIDTLANLLYKTGNTTESIALERKAILLAKNNSDKKVFEKNLSSMEKGEPTW